MKKIIIILVLNVILNICRPDIYANADQEVQANQVQNPNCEAQQIKRTKFLELIDAIDKIDVVKTKLLISNQITLYKAVKEILSKKIDCHIDSLTKSIFVRLLIGVPLASIGIKFFYNRFKFRKIYLEILLGGDFSFTIMDDTWDQILKQTFLRYYGKSFTRTPASHVYFNLPLLIFMILGTIKGSELIIEVKRLVLEIQNLKEIKKLIQDVSV